MLRTSAWAVLLMLGFSFVSAPCHAAEPDDSAVKRAAERGRLIYELDRAAWVSTDEMLKRFPKPSATGIRGWIVEVLPDRLKTTYYREQGDRPVAAYIVESRGRAVISEMVPNSPEEEGLTPLQVRMIEAREVAGDQPVQRCTNGPMNTVVIPPQTTDQPVEVYELSPQVKNDEYPLGGHFLFVVGPSGDVISHRKFTNACLNMAKPATSGGKVAAMFVTHILDATPTEIHVFSAFTADTPIYVGTPLSLTEDSKDFRVWAVTKDKITLTEMGGK